MIDRELLRRGAAELVDRCLAVTAADRMLVLTDAATAHLAEHLRAAGAGRARTELVTLPALDRDYAEAFAALAAAIDRERPTVVVFAARDDGDRLAWDDRYWTLLDGLSARSAHLPALDENALGVGLATDYDEVARFTEAVTAALSGAREVRIVSESGTDIVFRCDPERVWTPFTGLYRLAGEGGRLPQGEVFCSPVDAEGVIAASVIGYPFNAGTGLLETPARFSVAGARLTGIEHPDASLATRLREHFASDGGSDRVGELAFGTNRACTELSGNLLFDENVPGCHIAFGHPFGDYTGADWHSGVHVDLVVDRPTIVVDGIPLIVSGEYVDTVRFDTARFDAAPSEGTP